MRNQALVSLFVTVFLHASLAGGVVAVSGWGSGDGDEDEDVERKVLTIEASLAYRSEKPSDLPQKETRRKPKKRPPKKAAKVKKVAPGTPEDKPDEPDETQEEEDFASQVNQYLDERQNQEETDEADDNWEEDNTDVEPAGTFDGSKHGFAEVSRGDPYMQELAAQVYGSWELTSLEKDAGEAVGCVRLAADGSVLAVDLWKEHKTNTNLNLSVNHALEAVKKKRTSGTKPVPVHLKDATTQWTCFKFSIDQGP